MRVKEGAENREGEKAPKGWYSKVYHIKLVFLDI
jgi:hypothetical protein